MMTEDTPRNRHQEDNNNSNNNSDHQNNTLTSLDPMIVHEHFHRLLRTEESAINRMTDYLRLLHAVHSRRAGSLLDQLEPFVHQVNNDQGTSNQLRGSVHAMVEEVLSSTQIINFYCDMISQYARDEVQGMPVLDMQAGDDECEESANQSNSSIGVLSEEPEQESTGGTTGLLRHLLSILPFMSSARGMTPTEGTRSQPPTPVINTQQANNQQNRLFHHHRSTSRPLSVSPTPTPAPGASINLARLFNTRSTNRIHQTAITAHELSNNGAIDVDEEAHIGLEAAVPNYSTHDGVTSNFSSSLPYNSLLNMTSPQQTVENAHRHPGTNGNNNSGYFRTINQDHLRSTNNQHFMRNMQPDRIFFVNYAFPQTEDVGFENHQLTPIPSAPNVTQMTAFANGELTTEIGEAGYQPHRPHDSNASELNFSRRESVTFSRQRSFDEYIDR